MAKRKKLTPGEAGCRAGKADRRAAAEREELRAGGKTTLSVYKADHATLEAYGRKGEDFADLLHRLLKEAGWK